MTRELSFAPAPTESLGQRIAQLRAVRGWTQEQLAERIAASRTAVSQFEAGLALPSERTIVLLAGLFRLEPHELVDGTNYPRAKAERLPPIALRYSESELRLALLRRDLEWAARLRDAHAPEDVIVELLGRWGEWLAAQDLTEAGVDPAALADARAALRAALGRR